MVNNSSFFARDAIPLLSSFIASGFNPDIGSLVPSRKLGFLRQLRVLLSEHVPLQ